MDRDHFSAKAHWASFQALPSRDVQSWLIIGLVHWHPPALPPFHPQESGMFVSTLEPTFMFSHLHTALNWEKGHSQGPFLELANEAA